MGTIAFVNARLVDGNGGPPTDGAVIVVEDTAIAAVTAGDETVIPRGAAIVDCRGRTVIPGMFELHAHLGSTYLAVRRLGRALGAGFTTVANVVSDPQTTVELRDAVESGWLPQCSRVIAGSAVVPTNGHVAGRIADGPWEVRKAVRELVEMGVDFIKTAASGGFAGEREEAWWPNYTGEELTALVEQINDYGRQAVVHVHTQPGLNLAIEAGAHQIHHGALIDEEALQGIKQRDLLYVPTLRVTSMLNIAAHEEAGKPWAARKMTEAHDVHRKGVRRAHELGIRIATGTDFPSAPRWWNLGSVSAFELAELVDAGLTPMEAIVAATKMSAEGANLGERLGTIEVGKTADVVVVDQDPLEDIRVLIDLDNIRQVMKDGRIAIDRDRGFFGELPT
jgi:imidazolonepropionase-like amidohydrolase